MLLALDRAAETDLALSPDALEQARDAGAERFAWPSPWHRPEGLGKGPGPIPKGTTPARNVGDLALPERLRRRAASWAGSAAETTAFCPYPSRLSSFLPAWGGTRRSSSKRRRTSEWAEDSPAPTGNPDRETLGSESCPPRGTVICTQQQLQVRGGGGEREGGSSQAMLTEA